MHWINEHTHPLNAKQTLHTLLYLYYCLRPNECFNLFPVTVESAKPKQMHTIIMLRLRTLIWKSLISNCSSILPKITTKTGRSCSSPHTGWRKSCHPKCSVWVERAQLSDSRPTPCITRHDWEPTTSVALAILEGTSRSCLHSRNRQKRKEGG